MNTNDTEKTTAIREHPGAAVLIQHSAIWGRIETPIRNFKVGPVMRPLDKWDHGVVLTYKKPRERGRFYCGITPNHICFVTIEIDGQPAYDSRVDVACDMGQWQAKHENPLSSPNVKHPAGKQSP